MIGVAGVIKQRLDGQQQRLDGQPGPLRRTLGLGHVGVRASSSGAPVHAGYRLAVRGGLVPDRHVEHCRWAEQRAMAHQDERRQRLVQYGGLFMG